MTRTPGVITSLSQGKCLSFASAVHYSTTTTPVLQSKLTLSQKRLRPKRKPKLGPSVPLCILILLGASYMTYTTRKSSNDDRMFR
ncbi:hypothetical protein DPX39_080022400 [Trypanosoma brucei equiperdum]|uniref:Transmembrane protein n=1 Tax=Trypanosoma brucei equiperdum TaxID=630700 RepID=A0A3L6L2I5_9TRYP|nr:hypothetical protein DPX39_080022400 [Trypanosoma brucei equiperdum]